VFCGGLFWAFLSSLQLGDLNYFASTRCYLVGYFQVVFAGMGWFPLVKCHLVEQSFLFYLLWLSDFASKRCGKCHEPSTTSWSCVKSRLLLGVEPFEVNRSLWNRLRSSAEKRASSFFLCLNLLRKGQQYLHHCHCSCIHDVWEKYNENLLLLLYLRSCIRDLWEKYTEKLCLRKPVAVMLGVIIAGL